MSLVLNMIGGGGSFTTTDAILRVQAPANAIVTISKGGTVKTDYGHENIADPTVYDYYFIIHQSQFDSLTPWSVTATVQGITNTKTIIINASDEYDLIFKCKVPDEYQEVEYLQANNAPWLSPDWQVDDDYLTSSKVEIGYLFTAVESTGRHVMGCWSGTTTSTFIRAFGLYYANSSGAKQTFQVGGYNGDTGFKTGTANTVFHTVYDVTNGTANISCTNDSGGNVWSGSLTGLTKIESGRYIPLFAARDNTDEIVTFAKARIYYFKVTRLGVLVKDLVPCYRISDSVAGMYDRISNSFYTNQGSGSFTVGGDVPA